MNWKKEAALLWLLLHAREPGKFVGKRPHRRNISPTGLQDDFVPAEPVTEEFTCEIRGSLVEWGRLHKNEEI